MSGKGDKKRRRALDAYARLQRVAELSAAQVEAAVAPFGLTASQYGVLDTVATRGAVHQQEIAEALGRSKAQMTAIIDALEARGLVRRERHPVDRRFITVHLTPAGRTLLAQAAPARAATIVALMGVFSGEQRARFARLCRRLQRAIDPYEADEAEEDDADADLDGSDPIAAFSTDSFPHSNASDGRTALPPDSRTHAGT